MIAGAQYTIVDLSDPIQQGTAPANPVTGMLWLDTSASPPMLRRWNGTSWEDVGDSGAGAEALEEINKLKAWNEIVVGTQTSATASWTGTVSFDSMTDGMQITYWLPQTSGSSATLDLTLKDGSTTGAIPLYYGGTTRISTQYPAGSVLHLHRFIVHVEHAEHGGYADDVRHGDGFPRTYRHHEQEHLGAGLFAALADPVQG